MALPSIDLQLPQKLKEMEYRKAYFLAESSAHIARQLIELRKKRKLNQQQLAELASTGQPAISRAERADYHSWSFSTLRHLAEAMDARIRVYIQAAEDVLPEYEVSEKKEQILGSVSDDSRDEDNFNQQAKKAWPTGSIKEPDKTDKKPQQAPSIFEERVHGISGY
jgi:transcriptional regulator with XRE-family HTH domain